MGARSDALTFARTSPFRGSVLNGNAQNPTAFAGNVGLDDDIGLHVLQALTSPLYIWLT
jgi:hypothetical protein